ncbi:MAG: DMT family transporter [Rhodobacteraceae bacterium]|nr:DMT family transporter [Alphaproteobacteria bacterium]NNK65875.1 DMT family transporter [Paracoccaceae bacterium]
MTEAPYRPLLAALWMTGAIGSFSAMAVAGRALSDELDTFEMMFYRSCIGVVLVLVIGGALGRLTEITTRNLHLHIGRNMCHFTGQNLWFFALTLIPLAQLFALEFTTPIWVILLASLFLGERITRVRAFCAALGFAGVLIVARPGSAGLDPGLLIAAGAAVCFAGTFIFTKLLTRTATVTCILFWLTVMQLVFGLIATGYDGDIAWPSGAAWPWVAVIGAGGLLAHLCVTNALTIAPASVVVPLDFLRLPLIAIIGMLFYNEPLDAWVLLGAGVIFAANYLNIRSETRKMT